MLKRGQITLFIALGFVILIAFGFVFYVGGAIVDSRTSTSVSKVGRAAFMTVPIKEYIGGCLRTLSEDILFDKVGIQGGYIDIGNADEWVNFDYSGLVYSVPYSLDGNIKNTLSLEDIQEDIEEYIDTEFVNCLNFNSFEGDGYEITNEGSISTDVVINKNDISIQVKTPLIVKKEDSETEIKDFVVNLPIRLNHVYSIADDLIEDVKLNGQDPENVYDLSSNCDNYDASSDADPEILIKINKIEGSDDDLLIRILDYDCYFNDAFVGHYHKPFIFQFVVKNVYVDGDCYW